MSRISCALTLLLLTLSPVQAADAPQGQWIVVTAPAFRKALEPLCEQRKAQGLKVVVIQTTDVLTPREIHGGDAVKLRDHIRKQCKDHPGPSFVLLVGTLQAPRLAESEKIVVPSLPGTAGRMKGRLTDNGYGCQGDSLLPTVAVGRFPVRSEKEAKGMVQKTLDFERDDKPGLWKRRVTVLAGIPAFNDFVDRMVEGMAMLRFERLDPIWSGRALYHNATSYFSVPDTALQATALRYVQDGQAITCYFGHSGAEAFYAGNAHYLDRNDWARLKIGRGRGVLATFGCYGCQLRKGDDDGYGVAAARNADGPTAVLGSYGECFAAMVQLAADGLIDSTLAGKVPTRLADSWLACKKSLAEAKIDDFTFRMLNAVDGDPRIPLATQRLEHLEMFVLLGDPALRLPVMPSDLDLKIDGKAAPGATITVRGTAPARLAGAKVRLTLERPVTSEAPDLGPVPKEPGKARDRAILLNHERANNFVLAEAEVVVKDGRFEARLKLPVKLPGAKCFLRAYAATDRHEAMNVLRLETDGKKD